MIKRNQDGAANGLVVSLVFAVVMLVAATAFGGWAFMSRQDYKSNTDAKIKDAVIIAKQEESTAKDKQFVEKEKNPLRTYKGPDSYGGVTIQYPKTWSAYVQDTGSGSNPVNGYFNPSYVPSTDGQGSTLALRLQVTNQAYAQTLNRFTSLQKSGKVRVTPYVLPKVPSAVGVQVTGEIESNKQGTMVILPLRAGTVIIWSEGSQYQSDFQNIILPNATFVP